MQSWDTAVSVCLGIGLSAACGFRIFVPLLALSLASLSGHLTLASGFSWLGTYPALVVFAVATAVEIAGYYLPWVDHALDTIATPTAVLAGTLIMASVVTGMSPLMKWTLALIAGGGIAGLVQGATVLTRGASSATTLGLGNPMVATAELGGSILTSSLAIIAPVVAVAAILVAIAVLGKRLVRNARKPACLHGNAS